MDTTSQTPADFQSTLDSITNLIHGIGVAFVIALIVGVVVMAFQVIGSAKANSRVKR